jgi:hypothetical protein
MRFRVARNASPDRRRDPKIAVIAINAAIA